MDLTCYHSFYEVSLLSSLRFWSHVETKVYSTEMQKNRRLVLGQIASQWPDCGFRRVLLSQDVKVWPWNWRRRASVHHIHKSNSSFSFRPVRSQSLCSYQFVPRCFFLLRSHRKLSDIKTTAVVASLPALWSTPLMTPPLLLHFLLRDSACSAFFIRPSSFFHFVLMTQPVHWTFPQRLHTVRDDSEVKLLFTRNQLQDRRLWQTYDQSAPKLHKKICFNVFPF